MSKLLTLSRAARLADVSRGQLQNKLRELNIETFEGKLSIEGLLEAYPQLDLDEDPVFERTQKIKANAKPRSSYTDNWTPEPEVLMARLHDFRHVLARTKSTLNMMEALLSQVTDELNALSAADEKEIRSSVQKLASRLQQSIDKAETTTDRKAELFAKDAILRFIAVSARLTPSGHEFFVEGKDSLLDAALKSGLHLDYGCASGNCGKCKVRVLKGSVKKIREHDYILSAQEQDENYCLACSNTAVSDVLIEAGEALSAADLPLQEIRCRVRKIEAVTGNLLLVSVKTPKTKTLRFMAGQQISMTLENGKQRTLSIASCPCDGLNLQFLVKLHNDDPFAQFLLSKNTDQTVLIQGPKGNFLLQEESLEPAIFVSVDDGFAAIKSLIEHAIAIDNAVGMYLYRIDKMTPASMLDNLCRSWDDALDNFVYQRLPHTTTPEETFKAISASAGNIGKQIFYIAGPATWVSAFEALTREHEIPEQQVYSYFTEEE